MHTLLHLHEKPQNSNRLRIRSALGHPTALHGFAWRVAPAPWVASMPGSIRHDVLVEWPKARRIDLSALVDSRVVDGTPAYLHMYECGVCVAMSGDYLRLGRGTLVMFGGAYANKQRAPSQ